MEEVVSTGRLSDLLLSRELVAPPVRYSSGAPPADMHAYILSEKDNMHAYIHSEKDKHAYFHSESEVASQAEKAQRQEFCRSSWGLQYGVQWWAKSCGHVHTCATVARSSWHVGLFKRALTTCEDARDPPLAQSTCGKSHNTKGILGYAVALEDHFASRLVSVVFYGRHLLAF